MEAIITGIVAILVCVINNVVQGVISRRKHNETITLIEYRLNELSKKVDKHNSVIERTFELEKQMELHEEKIKVANHRIEDLERKDELYE